METKEIEVGNRKFQIKEMAYVDVMGIRSLDDREKVKRIFEISGIPNDVVLTLSVRDGEFIMNEINKLNGFNTGDFQQTSTSEAKK